MIMLSLLAARSHRLSQDSRLPVDIGKDGVSFFKRDAYIAAFAPDVPKAEVEFMAASQVRFSVEKSRLAPLAAAA